MNIAIAGTGYVGLVTGVCLAGHGHSVTCVDIDQAKIDTLRRGKAPFYEPGLEELLADNADRLTYTTRAEDAYRSADVIFIGVGTPEKKDGSANLSYVFDVARQIARSVTRDCVVVVKSTVPIGTNDKVERLIHQALTGGAQVAVVSNPEFLAQGRAIRDTLYPSRIVIGTGQSWAREVMRDVYRSFDAPIVWTDRRSAEMVKYAANDFLALKLSYINEIANLCELVGANIDDVARGIGYDERIGDRFLNAGIGYGGSCFPKDTKALHWLASFHEYELKTIKAAIEVNENQRLKLIKKARRHVESFEGLTIAVLGLAFKPETDDLREAPSLVNVPIFLDDGAVVRAWDTVAQQNFQKLYPELLYCPTPEDALDGADMCFIFTEWAAVRALPPEAFTGRMKTPRVFDGRNCFDPQAMRAAGVLYESIGRA